MLAPVRIRRNSPTRFADEICRRAACRRETPTRDVAVRRRGGSRGRCRGPPARSAKRSVTSRRPAATPRRSSHDGLRRACTHQLSGAQPRRHGEHGRFDHHPDRLKDYNLADARWGFVISNHRFVAIARFSLVAAAPATKCPRFRNRASMLGTQGHPFNK